MWYGTLNIKACKLRNKYVDVFKIKGWNLFMTALDRKYEIANGNHDLHDLYMKHVCQENGYSYFVSENETRPNIIHLYDGEL